jgi:hypothetical protein
MKEDPLSTQFGISEGRASEIIDALAAIDTNLYLKDVREAAIQTRNLLRD